MTHIYQERPQYFSQKMDTDTYTSKHFHRYLKAGGGLIQKDGLHAGDGSHGGYLVPEVLHSRLDQKLHDLSPLRQVANILKISRSSVDILVNRTAPQVGWAGETDPRDETDAPDMVKIKIPAHELYAKPRATQKLLEDAQVNVEEWLVQKVSEQMALRESHAFIHGDGDNKPKGLLAYDLVDAGDYAWGNIEKIRTGAQGAFAEAHGGDALIDVLHRVPTHYLKGAVWLMSPSALAAVRKLKDESTGQYLWQPGFGTTPANLLGYPVVICDAMPALIPGRASPSIFFGNFKEAYQIVDRADMHVMRDPYSAKPHVEFYVTRRVGADVINFDAIKALSFEALEADAEDEDGEDGDM